MNLPLTNFASTPMDNEMARLFWHRFNIQRAAALFYYQAGAGPSNLIYDLKYHNRRDIGIYLGKMAAASFQQEDFFEDIDCIIPAPLAKKRLKQRGYNQSMEIALGVAEITHLPIEDKVLKRKTFLTSQTHKDKWQRAENVKDAFELADSERIYNKHVLIIDDVVTTGATITECAKALSKAGDVKISVLALGFAKS